MSNYELEDGTDIEIEEESEPVGFWENKQKELVLSVVDYNLGSLADLVESQNIDLSPNYQRRVRWDDERQSKLIESFLMNVPVPPIFLNEDDYGRYSVIDGKQRLTAIREFLRGALRLTGLKVFADLNGKRIDDLPSRLQSVLRTRSNLRATIILHQSDKDVKYEVFRRLNSGGMKLNAQEIRNSVFPGNLNKLILELSALPDFHRLLGIDDKDVLSNKNKLYNEMGDAEFVLRYFALRDTWQAPIGTAVRTMDSYMETNQNLPSTKVKQFRTDFLNTISLVNEIFGDNAFQRWYPDTQKWRSQPIRALYDVQMIALQGRSLEQIAPNREQILQVFQTLFDNEDFLRAIDGGQPAEIQRRILMFKEVVDAILEGE